MPAFGRGFLFAALGPRGCAPPGTPAGGAPCTAPYKRLRRRPCRGPLAEGQGCRGRAPPTPCRQAWVAPVASRGRVLALRGCGPHQPLDPPFTRKTRQRPAQGRRGTVGVDGGQGSRAARSLALTPRNDPNAPGWWLGVLFPQPPATGAPGGPPERSLPLIFASEVWGFGGGTPLIRSQRNRPSEAQGGPFVYPGFRSEHDKRSLRKCALASLRGLERRHPEAPRVDLLGEHVQRVRVALWGFLRGLLAALDHALDPSIRHSLLALWSSAITWFRALPFQPNSGLSL